MDNFVFGVMFGMIFKDCVSLVFRAIRAFIGKIR